MRNVRPLSRLAAASTGMIIAVVLAAPPVLAARDPAVAPPSAATASAAYPGSRGVQPGGPMIPSTGPLTRREQPATYLTSPNWSGLEVSAGAGYFTSVYGSWTQPAATCGSGDQYAAFWVGLDGFADSTVEQTGSTANCSGSTPVYQVWYEMYPNPPVYFSNPVRPGDLLTGSVTYNGGSSFTLTLADSQKGWSNTVHASLSGAKRSSAEAIVEAPLVNGNIAPLTNFGTVSFGAPDLNGRKITNYSSTVITMVDSSGLDKDIIIVTELGNFNADWKRST